MSLLSRFARLASLPIAAHRLFLLAFAVLTLTAVGLRWVGFRRLSAILQRLAPASRCPALNEREPGIRIRRNLEAVRRAAAYCPLETRCLARSLTLWWLLRRARVNGSLRVGVRIQDGAFESHAWVEFEGRALNDGADVRERFVLLDAPLWEQINR